MENDALEVSMINTTRISSKLMESMFHIDDKMHQSIHLSMDVEIKADVFCLMKCTEIYNNMKRWDDLLLKKK